MLKKLFIQNFQSHEKTELNLSPGVNIITGVSLSGKTAILRALRWLVHNRPLGDRVRSHFAEGATKVMIETSEGDQIWHIKDDKTNAYAISGSTIFDKTGKEIPDQVIQALRMTELNMQNQLDSPFLVTSSAGEVAKTINRITQLEMVDSCISDLTTTINTANREKDQLIAKIETTGIEIKSYQILADLQPIIDKCTVIETRQNELIKLLNNINNLKDGIARKQNETLKYRRQLTAKPLIDRAEEIEKDIVKLRERSQAARSALKAYQTTQRLRLALEPTEKAYRIEEKIGELAQKLKIISEAMRFQQIVQTAMKNVAEAKTKLQTFLIEHKTCPTCLQPITESTMKKILGEI